MRFAGSLAVLAGLDSAARVRLELPTPACAMVPTALNDDPCSGRRCKAPKRQLSCIKSTEQSVDTSEHWRLYLELTGRRGYGKEGGNACLSVHARCELGEALQTSEMSPRVSSEDVAWVGGGTRGW